MILDGNEVEATGGPEREAGEAASKLVRSAVVGGAAVTRRHAEADIHSARKRTAAADLAVQDLQPRTRAEQRTERVGAGLAVGAALQPETGRTWDPEAAATAELTAQHFPRAVGSDLARAVRHSRAGAQEPELVPHAPAETVVELT
jgi:hypothetical protein